MADGIENLRGAALMSAGMAAFTLNDACMKALSDELPLFQALFLRGVATCLVLLVLARALGALKLDLPRRDWGRIALRTLAEIGAAYFFLTALFNMPLANVTAILQSLPLTVTLAGALVFGEAIGWRRLAAIGIGFVGVLLIVRPGAEGFTLHSTYALLSVGCVTVRDLATRGLGGHVPSLTVALAAALGVTLFGGAGSLLGAWAPISPTAAWQLGGATLFVALGYLCSVMVMRAGDLGFVAPFRYTSLVWALVLGLVLFGEWPEPLTLLGAAIVAATGLFTLYRERALARRSPPPPLRVR